MTKEIEELIKQLQKLDNIKEFDDIVLADMLWLALSMDEVQREKAKRPKKDFLKWLKDWLNSFLFSNVTKEKEKPLEKAKKQKTKYSKSVPISLDDLSSKNGTKIKVPKKKDFFISDELIKSLSSLKKSYASEKNSILVDEDATVDYIAKTGIFKPFFKPMTDNYFDLYLIIDNSASMEIWSDSIALFIDKMRSFSLFRSIKVLYLDTSKKDAKLYSNMALTMEVSSKLNNYEKRYLKFVITDCISPAWREGDFFYKLCEDNASIPTTVINMLPKRMWNGTILGNTNITQLNSTKEYPTNSNIQSEMDEFLLSMDSEYVKSDIYKLPVINLDIDSFKLLSDFILCKKDNYCDGIVATKEELAYKNEQVNSELSSSQQVEIFFKNSSPVAHKLALYLSVTTHLNFAIMKMIQHNMLPDSKQIHLAEVFVGGLLEKSENRKFYTFKIYTSQT